MRLIVNTALILAALAVLGATAVAAEITLNVSADAKYQFVKLADLGTVSGASAEETKKVSDIFCGPAPAPGEVRQITADYIRMRLRQSGLDPKSFTFKGAEVVKLRTVIVVELPLSQDAANDASAEEPKSDNKPSLGPEAVPVSVSFQDKIIAAIAGLVAEKLYVKAEGVQVAVKTVAKALQSCDAASKIISVTPARDVGTLGSISFTVAAKSGEREIRGSVTAEIALNLDVVVAAQPITADTLLVKEMLATQRIRITSNPADYITSLSSLDGFKATKNIAVGQAVTAAMVQQPVFVKRGDVVKVFVRVTGTDVVVETTARAEKEGRKGEFINVTNVNSKETFSAQVTGPREVQVTVGGK
jgi:flagella basal body P-ring formation protein FlgA